MKIKTVGILLIVLFLVNSSVAGNNVIKYSDVTTGLITAETFDEAKNIVSQYDFEDQRILHNHLQLRQKSWVAEHGLFDNVVFGTNFIQHLSTCTLLVVPLV